MLTARKRIYFGHYFGHYFRRSLMKEYKPTLTAAKGKWYVSMTVPEELRQQLGGQIKLSTGTNDKNEAQKRLPALAVKLKQKIDDAASHLKNNELKNGLMEIASKLGRVNEFNFNDNSTENLTFIAHELKSSQYQDKVSIGNFNLKNIRTKAKSNLPKVKRLSPTQRNEQMSILSEISGINNSEANLFYSIATDWGEKKNWDRQKSKKSFHAQISSFVSAVGNLPIEDIKPITIYEFAEYMAEEKDSANATIKNYIASVSDVLNYALRKDLIPFNPAKGLDLKSYGKPKKQRRPFSEEQLHELFSLDLPEHMRLYLSILITTGMRLDEAALLRQNNIKTERKIRYFDLTEAVVKTKNSARKIPVPKIIQEQLQRHLNGLNGERLFNFPVDADGKAQNAASKAANSYVRKVTADPSRVVHSLRHNFKDLCRDAELAKEMHDFLTGHRGGDTASQYGSGPSLETKLKAINRLKHPYL